jgi:hypothetical protein
MNPMDADFPAAHSMDTAWFAVDADGHIAFFDTGENGLVPQSAWGPPTPPREVVNPFTGGTMLVTGGTLDPEGERTELLHHLSQTVKPGDFGCDALGHIVPGPCDTPHVAPKERSRGGMLLRLASTELVSAELEAGRAAAFPLADGVNVYFEKPAAAAVRRVHEAGGCLGCVRLASPVFRERPHEIPARLGCFEFAQLDGEWLPGPYGRIRYPLHPLHIDMLPPLWRRRAGQVRLGWAHFRDSAHLQPLEHEPCTAWCSAYLSADGLRILPASDEEAYREVIEALKRDAPQLLAQLAYDPPPKKPRRKQR